MIWYINNIKLTIYFSVNFKMLATEKKTIFPKSVYPFSSTDRTKIPRSLHRTDQPARPRLQCIHTNRTAACRRSAGRHTRHGPRKSPTPAWPDTGQPRADTPNAARQTDTVFQAQKCQSTRGISLHDRQNDQHVSVESLYVLDVGKCVPFHHVTNRGEFDCFFRVPTRCDVDEYMRCW